MKKVIYSSFIGASLLLASCGGSYSKETGKKAEKFCKCAEENEVSKENPMALLGCIEHIDMENSGSDYAIKDKCPDIYDKLEAMSDK